MREGDDLQPHLVHRIVLEWELAQAGVFVVADAVLDMRVLTVAALQHRDVLVALVGQDRLEALAINVGEGQLRAGVRPLRPFTPDDQPGPFRPRAEVQAGGDLNDLPVVAFAAVGVQRRDPASFSPRGRGITPDPIREALDNQSDRTPFIGPPL